MPRTARNGASSTPGVRASFHLGFEAVLDEAVPQARAAGLEVLMAGRRDNGTGFVYYDTLEATGLVWMNRQTRPVEAE
jgi:hypothetical protein